MSARRLATAAVISIVGGALSPATAARGGEEPFLAWLPPPARPALATAQRTADTVRAAVETGSFERALAAMIEVGGAPGPAVPALPAPPPEGVASLASQLPPGLGAPVAGLEAAVRRAGEMIGPIPAGEARDLFRRTMDWLHRTARARPGHPPAPLTATPTVRRAVAAMPGAALLVAAALDRYLPALRAAAPPPTGLPAAPCDMVDEPPYLCVSGSDDHTYTQDMALLIDLGGKDTYRNDAGAAPFEHAPGGVTYFPVSVNIDLAGDDLYRPTPDPEPMFSNVTGNGAGFFGGVGVLVDAAGNDLYSAAPSEGPDIPARWGVVAQGAGIGGTGLLFDLSGDDRYEVGEGTVGAVAQGAGLFCAAYIGLDNPRLLGGCPVGGLVDLGRGDDRYEVRPGPAARGEVRQVDAQALGNLGTGVVYDGGGTDGFLIETHTLATARPGAPPSANVPPDGSVAGQARASFGATALLLTGDGDTTYEIEMRSDARAFNRAWAQAMGVGEQGQAVIDDLGGNDLYRAEIEMVDHREVVVDDSCECEAADVTVDARPVGKLHEIDTFLQGAAYFDGISLIHDRGGNDTYVLSGRHDFEVVLRDRLSEPARPPRLEVRGYALPYIRGQGYGLQASAAALVDDAGTDRYVLRSLNVTAGSATSEHAAGEPEVAAVAPTSTLVGGQGAGNVSSGVVGALLDLGGTGDRFEASSSNVARSSSGPVGEFPGRAEWPWLQGGFGGLLVALGEQPVIVSSPSRTVCLASPGRRGFGAWLECYPTAHDPEYERDGTTPLLAPYGAGLAPGATGRSPSLAFTEDSATTGVARVLSFSAPYTLDTPRLPVGVLLAHPDGEPIAGAVVHLTLQRGCHLLCTLNVPTQTAGRYQWNIWEVDAVTDADGVARGSLPLRFLSSEWRPQFGELLRVTATYDGGPGIYPRHVALPLTLTRES